MAKDDCNCGAMVTGDPHQNNCTVYSVYDRYRNGHYTKGVKEPESPKNPFQDWGRGDKWYDTPAVKLKDADLLRIIDMRRQYAEAEAAYQKKCQAWYDALRNVDMNQIKLDLEIQYALTDHPKRDVVWSKTCADTNDVALIIDRYDDLVELM